MSRVGFALCGSFCTLRQLLPVISGMVEAGHEVTPILSECVAQTDTRFITAADLRERLYEICGNSVIDNLVDAEPIGPKKLLDILIVAPCTGNTLAKLANGIADSSVTLACKAHLRNERPLLIAVSTNDALAGNAANIGKLMARKHLYFVPLRQDDAEGKPTSCVADFTKIPEAAALALKGRQLQPTIL